MGISRPTVINFNIGSLIQYKFWYIFSFWNNSSFYHYFVFFLSDNLRFYFIFISRMIFVVVPVSVNENTVRCFNGQKHCDACDVAMHSQI